MEPLDLAGVREEDIPLALAELHWATGPGDVATVRFTQDLDDQRRQDLIEGAGFEARGSHLTRVQL